MMHVIIFVFSLQASTWNLSVDHLKASGRTGGIGQHLGVGIVTENLQSEGSLEC